MKRPASSNMNMSSQGKKSLSRSTSSSASPSNAIWAKLDALRSSQEQRWPSKGANAFLTSAGAAELEEEFNRSLMPPSGNSRRTSFSASSNNNNNTNGLSRQEAAVIAAARRARLDELLRSTTNQKNNDDGGEGDDNNNNNNADDQRWASPFGKKAVISHATDYPPVPVFHSYNSVIVAAVNNNNAQTIVPSSPPPSNNNNNNTFAATTPLPSKAIGPPSHPSSALSPSPIPFSLNNTNNNINNNNSPTTLSAVVNNNANPHPPPSWAEHKRVECSDLSFTDYLYARYLFSCIDQAKDGFIRLHDLVQYRLKLPNRIPLSAFEHLVPRGDGKVYIDEWVGMFFPKIPKSKLTATIKQYEDAFNLPFTCLTMGQKRELRRMYERLIVNEMTHENTIGDDLNNASAPVQRNNADKNNFSDEGEKIEVSRRERQQQQQQRKENNNYDVDTDDERANGTEMGSADFSPSKAKADQDANDDDDDDTDQKTSRTFPGDSCAKRHGRKPKPVLPFATFSAKLLDRCHTTTDAIQATAATLVNRLKEMKDRGESTLDAHQARADGTAGRGSALRAIKMIARMASLSKIGVTYGDDGDGDETGAGNGRVRKNATSPSKTGMQSKAKYDVGEETTMNDTATRTKRIATLFLNENKNNNNDDGNCNVGDEKKPVTNEETHDDDNKNNIEATAATTNFLDQLNREASGISESSINDNVKDLIVTEHGRKSEQQTRQELKAVHSLLFTKENGSNNNNNSKTLPSASLLNSSSPITKMLNERLVVTPQKLSPTSTRTPKDRRRTVSSMFNASSKLPFHKAKQNNNPDAASAPSPVAKPTPTNHIIISQQQHQPSSPIRQNSSGGAPATPIMHSNGNAGNTSAAVTSGSLLLLSSSDRRRTAAALFPSDSPSSTTATSTAKTPAKNTPKVNKNNIHDSHPSRSNTIVLSATTPDGTNKLNVGKGDPTNIYNTVEGSPTPLSPAPPAFTSARLSLLDFFELLAGHGVAFSPCEVFHLVKWRGGQILLEMDDVCMWLAKAAVAGNRKEDEREREKEDKFAAQEQRHQREPELASHRAVKINSASSPSANPRANRSNSVYNNGTASPRPASTAARVTDYWEAFHLIQAQLSTNPLPQSNSSIRAPLEELLGEQYLQLLSRWVAQLQIHCSGSNHHDGGGGGIPGQTTTSTSISIDSAQLVANLVGMCPQCHDRTTAICISVAASAKTVEDRKAAQSEAALTALLTSRCTMLSHPLLLLASVVPFNAFQLLDQKIVACPERVMNSLPCVLTPAGALQLESLELFRDSFVAGGKPFDLKNKDVVLRDTFIDELLAQSRNYVSSLVRQVRSKQNEERAKKQRKEDAAAVKREEEDKKKNVRMLRTTFSASPSCDDDECEIANANSIVSKLEVNFSTYENADAKRWKR